MLQATNGARRSGLGWGGEQEMSLKRAKHEQKAGFASRAAAFGNGQKAGKRLAENEPEVSKTRAKEVQMEQRRAIKCQDFQLGTAWYSSVQLGIGDKSRKYMTERMLEFLGSRKLNAHMTNNTNRGAAYAIGKWQG